ncbi:beta-propeller domain-containing protein [Ilumatobacter fluminis]|nr:beta-propeller domain-containing protein [Ilumatobacter fluminis]
MGSVREHRGSSIAVAVAAAAIATAGCAPDGPAPPTASGPDGTTRTAESTRTGTATGRGTSPSDGTEAGGGSGTLVRAMAPFGDCDAFLYHVKTEAAERVGPYGLHPGGAYWGYDEPADEGDDGDAMDDSAAEEPASAPATDAAGDGGGGDGEIAGTNVQELGVDEADIVKTDGERLIAIDGNTLRHVDIADVDPIVTDAMSLGEGWDYELFLHDGRALVLGNGGSFEHTPVDETFDAEADFAGDTSMPIGSQWLPAAELIEIDLSDPSDLRVVATLQIEGSYLSARQVGDTVRLALSTSPQELPWVAPQSRAGEELATETNREVIARSTYADWTPSFRLTTDDGSTSGDLIRCDRINHPADFSGFDVVSVVDVDLAEGLAAFVSDDTVGVLASGDSIYSSLDRFYVATSRWLAPERFTDDMAVVGFDESFTSLHAFEFVADEPARYLASGTVQGQLLNQFSLDEHRGFLRVLTTHGENWDTGEPSETVLTVLEEQGDRLVAVGEVGGLGRGEQLYSARLLGDVGFAVTFRQVDPFYVLDLSDPTAPAVTGELKIPGFSTYLHPLDENRVLGVGQSATDQGQTTGLKVSIFDVSDPARPLETAQWTMPYGWSPAEYDHHAFQIVGSTVLLPVYDGEFGRYGAVALDVSDGVREIGWIEHDAEVGSAMPAECRTIEASVWPEDSEPFWIAQEMPVHLCSSDAIVPGDCERYPAEEMVFWGEETAMREALDRIDASESDIISWCYPRYDDGEEIVRIVVVDGVIYSVSRRTIQATSLDTLTPLAATAL